MKTYLMCEVNSNGDPLIKVELESGYKISLLYTFNTISEIAVFKKTERGWVDITKKVLTHQKYVADYNDLKQIVNIVTVYSEWDLGNLNWGDKNE